MKTKSAGTKFLEKFINLREKNPHVVADAVVQYLEKELGPDRRVFKTLADEGSLLRQFFGDEAYIVHIFNIEPEADKNVILLGKGVCYDSGGYDLKNDMKGMHYDKNGALLAIAAALDFGVEAKVFFVNNLIRNDAVVCGDILLEPNTGIKVLIDDTDAEGRIGLAYLLGETQHYKQAITMATLTGAAVGVTGERTYALVHSTEPANYVHFMHLALEGKQFWPAPFHKEYDKSVTSKIIGANIHSCPTFKYAGSSTAFSFLKKFRPKGFIHLDIAAMMVDKNGNGLVWGLNEVNTLIRVANLKSNNQ